VNYFTVILNDFDSLKKAKIRVVINQMIRSSAKKEIIVFFFFACFG